MTPVIGALCFAIIPVSWFGGYKYPKGIPAGLVAIAAGTLIAWLTLFGFNYGGMSLTNLTGAFANFGFWVPLPAFDMVFRPSPGVILVTAIPFGIYDLVEAMDNVESGSRWRCLSHDAGAHRRRYREPDRLPDGQSVHQRGLHRPSRLEGDGRRHRLFRATGVMVIVLSWFGIIAVFVAHPAGRTADTALHRHADRRAGVPGDAEAPCAGDRAGADPNIAAWGKF